MHVKECMTIFPHDLYIYIYNFFFPFFFFIYLRNHILNFRISKTRKLNAQLILKLNYNYIAIPNIYASLLLGGEIIS